MHGFVLVALTSDKINDGGAKMGTPQMPTLNSQFALPVFFHTPATERAADLGERGGGGGGGGGGLLRGDYNITDTLDTPTL